MPRKIKKTAPSISWSTYLCLLSTVILCLHLTSAEGNYNTFGLPLQPSDEPTWRYLDMNDWAGVCKSGLQQSPISFLNLHSDAIREAKELKSIKFSRQCHLDNDTAQVNIRNANDGIHLRFMQEKQKKMKKWTSCLTRDPVTDLIYQLDEIDFHIGAEHLLPSIHADGEMHIKFRATKNAGEINEFLYFAVPLKVTEKGNETSPSVALLDYVLTAGRLPPPGAMTSSALPFSISLFEFLPQELNGYYTYMGSLTHPPCTESVRWVVFASPISFTKASYDRLRSSIATSLAVDSATVGNARPPQPFNQREVLHYAGGKFKWRERGKGFPGSNSPSEHDSNSKKSSRKEKWSFTNFWQYLNQKASHLSWKHGTLAVLSLLLVIFFATGIRQLYHPPVVGVDVNDVRPLISREERQQMYGTDLV